MASRIGQRSEREATIVIWDGLLKRGYARRQVEAVMGGKLCRVYRDVIG